jgi:hypothetical protein
VGPPPYINCESPVTAGPLLADPAGQLVPARRGSFFRPRPRRPPRPSACGWERAGVRVICVPSHSTLDFGHWTLDCLCPPRAPKPSRRDPLSPFSHKTEIRPRSVFSDSGIADAGRQRVDCRIESEFEPRPGASENSPAFQRWVTEAEENLQSPGRGDRVLFCDELREGAPARRCLCRPSRGSRRNPPSEIPGLHTGLSSVAPLGFKKMDRAARENLLR